MFEYLWGYLMVWGIGEK